VPAFKTAKTHSHFKEHRQESPGITLIEFIAIHYLQEAVKDADFDKDQQLPFKTTDCCFNNIVANVLNNQPSLPMLSLHYQQREYPILDKCELPTPYTASIWQPPRA